MGLNWGMEGWKVQCPDVVQGWGRYMSVVVLYAYYKVTCFISFIPSLATRRRLCCLLSFVHSLRS